MITKNISKYLAAFFVGCSLAATTACSSDEDPFFSASENDAPRILNSDIPEGNDGQPALLTSIERTEHFTFAVIVTPVHFTTVTWLLDGEQIAEGDSIDTQLLAGSYTLQIVATSTKGLSTSRTCRLEVRPAAGDPNPGSELRERLVKQGTKATLHGSNMDKVKKIVIGTETMDAVYDSANGCVSYTVPNLPDGIYTLKLVDETGFVYGGGKIELNTDPQYPAAPEVTLWEGSFNVTWGTPFTELQNELIKHVQEGSVVRIYVTGEGQGAATTSWWRNILTGGNEDEQPGARGDIMISGDTILEYTLTSLSISLLNEQGGFFVVGNGYTVTKVTVQ